MSRIIAGSKGGRRIVMPPGSKTRPTTDRVREALFSAIASWAGAASGPADRSLAGLGFGDLYAGSGAVGLEAASRGADPVLLVEADRRTALLTRKNAADLGLSVQVLAVRVEQLGPRDTGPALDIIFLDPPYDAATTAIDELLAALVAGGWLAVDGLLVVERSRRTPELTWPAGIGEHWRRDYGETVLHFARDSVTAHDDERSSG
jgi:16S rRNA (guanine966-N2)-methyltransferase